VYLLDTSAILAFLQNEAGHEIVVEALATGEAWLAAATWFELGVQFGTHPGSEATLALLHSTVAGTVDTNKLVAETALEIRRLAENRIPAVDALIAASAKVRGFCLVHRDQHLARIPTAYLAQSVLPPNC
jgi:predicted nucleic acid-binding protein